MDSGQSFGLRRLNRHLQQVVEGCFGKISRQRLQQIARWVCYGLLTLPDSQRKKNVSVYQRM
jgi:hypothetical protein